ncbi:hypothetical protein ACKFKF_05725 [Phormidesmis sp. 146-12]
MQPFVMGALSAFSLSAFSITVYQPEARSLPLSSVSSLHAPILISRTSGSLPNGTNITSPQNKRGRATLRVINGNRFDAAIKLVDRTSGKTLRFVYVQANREVTLSGIPSCTCTLKFTTGGGWDQNARKFTRNSVFYKFDDPLNFRELRSGLRTRWVNYTARLNRGADGNAPSTAISERNF